MFKLKRILVPVDFSPESSLALDWAILLAKNERGAHIELCHVLPNITPAGPDAIAFDYTVALEKEKKAIQRKLNVLKSRIPKTLSSSYVIGRGSIAREIERYCEQMTIDLVVMTTHGRRGLSRFLHGSTTEETSRLVPCPVLVLHLNSATCETAGATCEKIGEGW